MSTVTGVIDKIWDNGNNFQVVIGDKRYGTKFKPKVEEGDTVSFEYVEKEWNGRTFFNITKKIKKVEESVPEVSSPAGTSAASSSYAAASKKVQPVDWDEKDRKIVRQHSQEMAIRLVEVALQNDALTLGAAKNKRMENLTDIVIKLTDTFVEDVYNKPADEAQELEEELVNDTDWLKKS